MSGMPQRPLTKYKLAREAIQRAQSVESQHGRSFGGHRHTGPNHPLIGAPPPSRRRGK